MTTQTIRFDYNNVMADAIGDHGLTEAEIEAALPHAAAAIDRERGDRRLHPVHNLAPRLGSRPIRSGV